MTVEVIVRPEAELDIGAAFRWYEERVPGLGHQFLQALDRSFALISREPELFQVVHKSVRRALIHKFPYGVFYLSEPGKVVVLAVMHTARRPRRWKARAANEG